MKEEEKVQHESFGLIRFTRTSGGNQSFFGSVVKQNHYIQMELSNACLIRDLTREYYSRATDEHTAIKIRMTSSQFAELITNLNIGEGVPCTFEYKDGKRFELPKVENRKEFILRKFEESMKTFGQILSEQKSQLTEMFSQKTISKKDREEAKEIMRSIIQQVESNIPFFLKCFQEDVEKIVAEAKIETEAAIVNKVVQAGFAKLQDDILKLENNETND